MNEKMEIFANSDNEYLKYTAKYIKDLIEDIQKPEYDSLEEDMRTIYTRINSLNTDENRKTLHSKLTAIEADLQDRSSPKFLEALKKLEELEESVLSLVK